ncbi:type II secretion system F family protein [Clostridium sp.]|uniref:type II secretion system F family protein n=1 Tax=Clostridium sp. TaxID=1506 RepID=UPI002FC6996E
MQFKYRATTIEGKYKNGKKKAKNYEELIINLRKENLFCISYETERINIFNKALSFISSKDLALFCKYMNTSLKAGMNICDILNLISLQFNNKILSTCLIEARVSIENGYSLNEALDSFPKIFPVFLRRMVYLGEETGKLQDIFLNLESYYQFQYKRNKKIINSLVYPSLVFIFSVTIGVFMITKILPKFVSQLANLGGELPNITKLYLNIGNFLNLYGIIVLPIIIITLGFIYYILKSFFIIEDISFIILKIPFVKSIVKRIFYTKFSYSMYILTSSGIGIISSLNIIVNYEKSSYFKNKLMKCAHVIERGESIHRALNYIGIFPKFFITMIGIGEENGTLEEMLKTSSEIFEEELNSALDKGSTLIEPILILLLGSFIGTIIIAIMIPILNLSTGGIR